MHLQIAAVFHEFQMLATPLPCDFFPNSLWFEKIGGLWQNSSDCWCNRILENVNLFTKSFACYFSAPLPTSQLSRVMDLLLNMYQKDLNQNANKLFQNCEQTLPELRTDRIMKWAFWNPYSLLCDPDMFRKEKFQKNMLNLGSDPGRHLQDCPGARAEKCPKECFGSAFGCPAWSAQSTLWGTFPPRFLGSPVNGGRDRKT